MRLGKYKIPKPLNEVMGKKFDVTEMSPGYKRGMVLKVYKAKLRELVSKEAFRQIMPELRSAYLTKLDEEDYAHPMLVIRLRPGSPWVAELQPRRYMLMKKLNDRLECDFLREVRFK